jgi:glycine betaine/proline transport system permease protein
MTARAIVLSAVSACLVVGLPLCVLAAKSDTFEKILRPPPDLMQTSRPWSTACRS